MYGHQCTAAEAPVKAFLHIEDEILERLARPGPAAWPGAVHRRAALGLSIAIALPILASYATSCYHITLLVTLYVLISPHATPWIPCPVLKGTSWNPFHSVFTATATGQGEVKEFIQRGALLAHGHGIYRLRMTTLGAIGCVQQEAWSAAILDSTFVIR